MGKLESDAVDVDGDPHVTTFDGHRLAVYRVDTGRGGTHPYEFELYVDGAYVASASILAHQGATGPPEGESWTKQLVNHGIEKTRREDHGFDDFGGFGGL